MNKNSIFYNKHDIRNLKPLECCNIGIPLGQPKESCHVVKYCINDTHIDLPMIEFEHGLIYEKISVSDEDFKLILDYSVNYKQYSFKERQKIRAILAAGIV